jgi:transcriptional regulator with XRE-family HTH domain
MTDMAGRIRRARRAASLSQSELARILDINRSAVAQWERVGGCSPTAANLSKVAVATQTQFEWLATGRGRMQPSAAEGGDTVLQLNVYAHDEIEERVLLGLRKLKYWQSLVVAEMIEGLGRGKLLI